MEKIINQYNEFISNEVNTWKNRFTWKGLYGKEPKYTTTIFKFFNETNILDTIERAYNNKALFLLTESLADSYIDWVKGKGKDYSKKEYTDMRNFFIGAIGEFFFVSVLNNVKSLMVYNGDNFERFDFHYVAPMLEKDEDFGIDLTGIANDTPCIFQVKFWNPYGKEKPKMEIFQKADSEGSRNGYIDQKDDKNIILCWLGSENSGLMNISRNKVYKDKIVVIGATTLEASVDDRNKIFWDNFYEKLIEMSK